jgi:hypothetical protein
MVAAGIVRAHRLKERAYYISALVSGLMLLAMVSAFLFQFVLIAVFIAAAFIASLVGLSRIREAFFREAGTQRQETNVSESLKAGVFLTWKGWFKLAAQWGVRKTMCAYVLFNTGIFWAVLFILIIFLGMVGVVIAAVNTLIVVVGSIVIFRRQIEENLRETI